MDYIAGIKQKANFLIDREHNRLIDFEQIIFFARWIFNYITTTLRQRANERNILVEITILPFPLNACDLQIDIGSGFGIFQ